MLTPVDVNEVEHIIGELGCQLHHMYMNIITVLGVRMLTPLQMFMNMSTVLSPRMLTPLDVNELEQQWGVRMLIALDFYEYYCSTGEVGCLLHWMFINMSAILGSQDANSNRFL